MLFDLKELLLGYLIVGATFIVSSVLGYPMVGMPVTCIVIAFILGQFLSQLMIRGARKAWANHVRVIMQLRKERSACSLFICTLIVLLSIDLYEVMGAGDLKVVAYMVTLLPILSLSLIMLAGSFSLAFQASIGRLAIMCIQLFAVIGLGITALAFIEPRITASINENSAGFAWIFLSILALMGASKAVSWVVGIAYLGEQFSRYTTHAMSAHLSADARKIVVTHEAGHALTYAALKEIPDYVEACIHKRPKGVVLGYVVGIRPDVHHCSKTFSEFSMLTALAGKAAEQAVFNQVYLGSSDDHKRWESYAKPYMSSHIGEYYFLTPSGENEVAHNVASLERLQKGQNDLLSRFFAANVEPLQALIAELDAKSKLTAEDLKPILARVVLPDDFPRL